MKRVGLNNCLAYDRWDAFIKSAHPCAGPGGPPTGRQRPEKSSSEDRALCRDHCRAYLGFERKRTENDPARRRLTPTYGKQRATATQCPSVPF